MREKAQIGTSLKPRQSSLKILIRGSGVAGEGTDFFLDDAPVTGFGFGIPIAPPAAPAAPCRFFCGFTLPILGMGFRKISDALNGREAYPAIDGAGFARRCPGRFFALRRPAARHRQQQRALSAL